MQKPGAVWVWRTLWGLVLLLGPCLVLLYAGMPADGGTGDLESFTPAGFRVQWLLEERPGGLQVGDVIVRAGGHTYAEWLDGAPRGPEWHNGAVIPYEVLRNGEKLVLPIRLAPVPLSAVLLRWGPQLLCALALAAVGSYIFWRRPGEIASRLLMLFCLMVALHLWGDAYNFQYATLPGQWRFALHFSEEYLSFFFCYATILHFTLAFPRPHPLLARYPAPVLFGTYLLHPLVVAVVMLLSAGWQQALVTGSRISFAIALAQAGLAIAAGVRAARAAPDPVSRAQVQWILWGSSTAAAIVLPGYVVPIALTGTPLIPHPIVMVLTVSVPVIFAIAIMRFRLFAIEVLINRTLVYGTLTVLLGGFYLLMVRLLTVLVQRDVLRWQDQSLVVFVATLSIALAFQPLRRWIQQLIDRSFYRERVDFRRVFLTFSRELHAIIEVPDLLRTLVERVTDLFFAAHGIVVLLDADGAPQQVESCHLPLAQASTLGLKQDLLERLQGAVLVSRPQDPLFPLLVPLLAPRAGKRDLVGVLALGPRRSGQGYSRDDMDLLLGLGEQAGMAVRVAQLIDEKRAEVYRTEAAEAANQAKSMFLTHVSHELRTPLSAILGYGEVLQEQAIESGYADILSDVTRIRTAGTQLLAMINGILDLSKIEAGRMELSLDEFELRSVIDEALLFCVPLVEKKGNTLSLDVPDDIGTMFADPVKVRQVLLNLLGNAAKFTSEGRITLAVVREPARGEEEAVCDEWLRFRVADTGIGMTPEQMTRIFKAFGQADPKIVRTYGGTGLGLTISQHFCRMMGGRIEVESEFGRGSVFTVHLPARVQAT